jgi:hypothetical protein
MRRHPVRAGIGENAFSLRERALLLRPEHVMRQFMAEDGQQFLFGQARQQAPCDQVNFTGHVHQRGIHLRPGRLAQRGRHLRVRPRRAAPAPGSRVSGWAAWSTR